MNNTQAAATLHWESLVESLRMELQEYGGLCVLIEKQQRAILKRNMPDYMELAGKIETQAAATSGLRAEREQKVREIAERCGLPTSTELKRFIPFFPEDAQPLLNALVDEINKLISKSNRRAKQNHMLLARAMQYTYELLQQISPQSHVKTYGSKGKSRIKPYSSSSAINTSA
jgi:flagellar biosynthesis/type III secretory pathway chaperone